MASMDVSLLALLLFVAAVSALVTLFAVAIKGRGMLLLLGLELAVITVLAFLDGLSAWIWGASGTAAFLCLGAVWDHMARRLK
jgi:hypothetical protein